MIISKPLFDIGDRVAVESEPWINIEHRGLSGEIEGIQKTDKGWYYSIKGVWLHQDYLVLIYQ